jgi:hypothetical protein
MSDAHYTANSWIVGKRTDLGLVLGGGVAVSLLLLLTSVYGTGFLVVAVAFAMLTDMPHVLQTHVRVLFDPEETRIHARPFYASLGLIAALVVAGAHFGFEWLLVSVWVYWQPYHVLKQHDGLMQIYAGKHGYRGSRTLGRAALFLGCGAPILHKIGSDGYRFGEYSVLGVRMPFSGVEIWTPPVPMALVAAVYAAAAVALALLVFRQLNARTASDRLPLPSLATLAVAVCSYNLAYLLVKDLWAMILIATSVHSLQYHMLSWLRNRRRFEGVHAQQTGRARLLAGLSQERNVTAYALFFAVLGAACMATESIGNGVIPLTLVLHHFYLDSIVWKRGRNPGLGRLLGMGKALGVPGVAARAS